MARRLLHHAVVLSGAVVGALLIWPLSPPPDFSTSPAPAASASAAGAESEPEQAGDGSRVAASCPGERPLSTPSGQPPRLSCREARAILDELATRFAGSLTTPRAREFGNLVVGWLDPHGLWSAAPDAPLGPALRAHAEELMSEMRRPPSASEPCATALALGSDLAAWVAELTRSYERSFERARPLSRSRAIALSRAPAFQDDPVTEPARALSSRLGDSVARFGRAFPKQGPAAAEAARARYLPELDAEAWSEVVLAAALRAYVPLVDPHGDWAPFEEEWSLYADDPGLDSDPRLWRQITRTAVGVRIVDGPHPPLSIGDLVLSVDGIATAGMPLEQAEQLARLEPPHENMRSVEVLRRGQSEPETLSVDFGEAEENGEHTVTLDSEEVRFGEGRVLVVHLPDVTEGLGEALGRLMHESRESPLSGVLLDLRGNGGGSTDAAGALIGLFLPGVPLFPLASHGQLLEVMHAGEPPAELRFDGPVAALVDGYTASAAEMIAGALIAYKRGPLLGSRTFGKGCIQEYVDDHEGKGVMRVTTLVFALPDGSPIQRVGLAPELLVAAPPGREREADFTHALPTYRGPDVRDHAIAPSPPWPSHHGRLGPCDDRAVCRALQRLGAPQVAPRSLAARRPRALSATTGRN
ncbi:MAG TPA: S41 family peptidase [Polyangiaceae bacterium]|nr:S41 family peptidase [Polyangiaceae bacterium]